MRPAHGAVLHLAGEAVTGDKVIFILCKRQIDRIEARKIICAVTIAENDHAAICFPQAGAEGAAIARTRFKNDAGTAFFCNLRRPVCTFIIDDQDFTDVAKAVIDGGQITLCLPDGKGDVLFLVQAGHKDSKVEPVHSHYLLEFELCQQNPGIFAS